MCHCVEDLASRLYHCFDMDEGQKLKAQDHKGMGEHRLHQLILV